MYADAFHAVRSWLDSYVGRYIDGDGTLGEVSRLKWEHSRHVAAHCREIAEELGWTPRDAAVGELLGLLHDVGRFSQFAEFGTFADPFSVDHGGRGVEVIRTSGVLDPLPEPDRTRILTAVAVHNRRGIPPGLDDRALPFAKLIRDADKLDIFRVIAGRIEEGDYRGHLRAALHIEQPGPVTPGAVGDILRGETVANDHIRTVADFGLMQMSWVFDINYPPAMRYLLERNFLELVAAQLPDEPGCRCAVERIFSVAEDVRKGSLPPERERSA